MHIFFTFFYLPNKFDDFFHQPNKFADFCKIFSFPFPPLNVHSLSLQLH